MAFINYNDWYGGLVFAKNALIYVISVFVKPLSELGIFQGKDLDPCEFTLMSMMNWGNLWIGLTISPNNVSRSVLFLDMFCCKKSRLRSHFHHQL